MREIPESERKIDRAKALRQFVDIYSFLSSMAIVYLVPSREGLQDMPYVANLGVVIPHFKDDTVIISNFTSLPRKQEAPLGKAFFELLGYKTIEALGRFEGEADLKYLGGKTYAGAWGSRTASSTLMWLERETGITIIPIHMTNPLFYHLDCALFPLSDERVLCATNDLDKDDVAALEKVTEVVSVSPEMGRQGITNCVRVNRVILCGTQFDAFTPADEEWQLERRKVDTLTGYCAKYGYEPVFFNTSEFGKSGAALSCLVMHLNYIEYERNEE
jgi:N-dimethylarginine dimethylaminohydrolase